MVRSYVILLQQGGNTRRIFTKANSTADAISNVLKEIKDGTCTIVAKPHNEEQSNAAA